MFLVGALRFDRAEYSANSCAYLVTVVRRFLDNGDRKINTSMLSQLIRTNACTTDLYLLLRVRIKHQSHVHANKIWPGKERLLRYRCIEAEFLQCVYVQIMPVCATHRLDVTVSYIHSREKVWYAL